MTDFEHITPCGGDCRVCTHYGADCAGCLSNGGKCVGMWENGCRIFECCQEHNAPFCGVCGEFPCEWLTNKIGEWDKGGIDRLARLAEEYRRSAERL